ncbi:4-hydroxyphenylacetate 3-monooxygenase, oxygenase component [Halobacillus shinanisalinarum]|uniref:4-hydroxyphenylacetate 3-monooxygenase, oxygenase component n=1 Tax=Halobacillus shinanisalinarum TaxID=2932258 RepID=A0ABY4H1I4_9BACI|nr:4-hydroxyphenylacetate 3-monooxygenase, oxygenase component [Halobacillus shinanisalinarum]UOQ94301.1 4-hydroxyphenylacetate 3-monooxygenase, oxygenase component [Halobacillus shinanisalinarum]
MGVRTGDQYKKSINQLKTDVWIKGERIKGEISEHPAFRGIIKSQAELYDLQHVTRLQDKMTYALTSDEERIGMSYLIPKTRADLERRREMVQVWARHSAGLMGRSPDYMNTVLAAFASSVHVLEGEQNCFPERLKRFYEYACSHDLSFTHTFVNPQNNRSKLAFIEEDVTNARVVKRIEEGLVIRGAKLLATQGGITDEIIVFSSPGIQDKAHAFAFSIPSDTEGLKFICRKSFVGDDSSYNSPLSSRFEEMDSIVVFDEVLVPWERVFFYDNIKAANDFYTKGNFVPFTLHQIVSRQVIKTEFILGLAQMIVDTINISEYQHVQSKVAEIIKGLESSKALLLTSEKNATRNAQGVMIPQRMPLYVAVNQFQESYPRFTEIIQLLGASGMVTIPEEVQFQSSIGSKLDHYLQGFEIKGRERVELFTLAFDLCMSGFGSRQSLYERFFFGDPIRLSQIIYQTYQTDTHTAFVKKMLEKEQAD